jgi:hypothetical protein
VPHIELGRIASRSFAELGSWKLAAGTLGGADASAVAPTDGVTLEAADADAATLAAVDGAAAVLADGLADPPHAPTMSANPRRASPRRAPAVIIVLLLPCPARSIVGGRAGSVRRTRLARVVPVPPGAERRAIIGA